MPSRPGPSPTCSPSPAATARSAIGGGGALEHKRVDHHGREQQLGLDVGKPTPSTPASLVTMVQLCSPRAADNRSGPRLEVADAVTTTTPKTVASLRPATDWADSLRSVADRRADRPRRNQSRGARQCRRRRATWRTRRKLTKGAGLVGVAGILNLVEQLGQDDGAHDGVVIGVLVTKDKNVCHGYPPLDMCTWT